MADVGRICGGLAYIVCAYGLEEEDAAVISDAIEALKEKEKAGVWEYIEDGATGRNAWRCDRCGKIARRNPHDKSYCSHCGARMRMEA